LSASRAAYIGGAAGTSNVLAGKEFGIPVLGTMAHSWIMSWPSEEEAFRAYAELYPEGTVFLIDTYDTLKSGVVNAITVGKALAAQGRNFGVRLDSGDIHYLSVEVRKRLDAAGLKNATISVSNDLDESIIQTLKEAQAPVNMWGVGTQMVTGGTEASFPGVYKLAAGDDGKGTITARMKFSDNPEKTTNPGVKQVWRITDPGGMYVADVLSLDSSDESDKIDSSDMSDKSDVPDSDISDISSAAPGADLDIIEKGKTYLFWHPSADYRRFSHSLDGNAVPLLSKQLKDGKPTAEKQTLLSIRDRVQRGLEFLDQSYKRLLNPHIYKVSITTRLRTLKLELIKSYLGEK
jgi:nicotinate phosphoribosyltransferase